DQQENSQSEIAKQLSISRTKVCEILKENKIKNNKVSPDQEFESDPEIIKLKKESIKEELKRKIRISQEPFETEEQLEEMQKRLDGFFEHIKTLTIRLNGILAPTDKWVCDDCGTEGKILTNVKCANCDKTTWWGWLVK
ncbi:unnamed protein product, partial [marine sediment metagenome]